MPQPPAPTNEATHGPFGALLSALPPISLSEMSSIKLMNRTDTKFLTTKAVLERLLQMVQGEYYVQQIDGERVSRYRTVYWDTPEHEFFREHNSGQRPRTKVRVRTYLGSRLTFLEIKRKDNHGKTHKRRIAVPSQSEADEAAGRQFLAQSLNLSFDELRPTLENQFSRITLVNSAKTERLTIDYDVHFSNYQTHRQAATGNLVIIELKRDGRCHSPIKNLLLSLRVKPYGFSKYCIGLLLTDGHLRRGLMKEKLIHINKIATLQTEPS